MQQKLICPYDHSPLQACVTGYICTACNRTYPLKEGIVCTLDRLDDFYEGAYENKTHYLPRSEKPWHIWPLWLINSGYVWTLRKWLPKGATVVGLGCAGGVSYFGQRYSMVGCDLSFSSLKLTDNYSQRLQCDAATCIPLPDNSVDGVVSSYFWEHIPPEIKPNILKECQRILKPGGKLVFLYDVETENPLIRRFKSLNISLYKRLFIDGDGHVGYQSPLDNITLFETAGFEVVNHQGMEKTWLQSPAAYTKLAQFSTSRISLLTWAAGLGCQPYFYLYTLFMRLIDTLICPWLPIDWARIDLVVCKKEYE
jgi:SAM-dependent methyltransferase